MTSRVVESHTESTFVNDLLGYAKLSKSHIHSLPNEIYDVYRIFNYHRTLMHHAHMIRLAVRVITNDSCANVDSTITDPFNKNETFLQHNEVIVRFYFTVLVMNFLRGTQTYPTEHQKKLINNIYLNVLDMQHPIEILDDDIPLLRLFATYIFKLRPKLVNIGEKEFVCDLFSNILSRIHAVIEVNIFLREG